MDSISIDDLTIIEGFSEEALIQKIDELLKQTPTHDNYKKQAEFYNTLSRIVKEETRQGEYAMQAFECLEIAIRIYKYPMLRKTAKPARV